MGRPRGNHEIRPFLQTQRHHLHFSSFCCPEDGREAVLVPRVNCCAMFQQRFSGTNLSSIASRSWRTSSRDPPNSTRQNIQSYSKSTCRNRARMFFGASPHRTYWFLKLSHMASPHWIKYRRLPRGVSVAHRTPRCDEELTPQHIFWPLREWARCGAGNAIDHIQEYGLIQQTLIFWTACKHPTRGDSQGPRILESSGSCECPCFAA